MASVQIPQLPLAIGLNGKEQLEIVQQGTSRRTTTLAVAELNAITLQNNITQNKSYYPIYSIVTNTTLTPNPILYTSDTHYNYVPSLGQLSAQRVEATQGMFLNAATITAVTYDIPAGDNAMSMGPISTSAIVTVPTGSVWGVL